MVYIYYFNHILRLFHSLSFEPIQRDQEPEPPVFYLLCSNLKTDIECNPILGLGKNGLV